MNSKVARLLRKQCGYIPTDKREYDIKVHRVDTDGKKIVNYTNKPNSSRGKYLSLKDLYRHAGV